MWPNIRWGTIHQLLCRYVIVSSLPFPLLRGIGQTKYGEKRGKGGKTGERHKKGEWEMLEREKLLCGKKLKRNANNINIFLT